jgi:uncharacterized protein YaeQ
MAHGDTLYHVQVSLSDVDRSVYESLDLRLARHPSESLGYLVTRLLAYCLSYEEGIEFSKGGLSSTDEAPVFVRDMTGLLRAWIDIGSPSTERLHRAAKAAPRVALFTQKNVEGLRADANAGRIHRAESIEVVTLPKDFVESLEKLLTRNVTLEIVHTDGSLFVTSGGTTLEASLERSKLAESGT